jgi:hypothetical protein
MISGKRNSSAYRITWVSIWHSVKQAKWLWPISERAQCFRPLNHTFALTKEVHLRRYLHVGSQECAQSCVFLYFVTRSKIMHIKVFHIKGAENKFSPYYNWSNTKYYITVTAHEIDRFMNEERKISILQIFTSRKHKHKQFVFGWTKTRTSAT